MRLPSGCSVAAQLRVRGGQAPGVGAMGSQVTTGGFFKRARSVINGIGRLVHAVSMMVSNSALRAKERLLIRALWAMLSLPGKRGCSCKSPFHRGPGNPDPLKGKARYAKLDREPGKVAA